MRVALPRAPTPPSGSATCALPCTCTVPFFAPAVSNAPAAPHSTDSAVGAVYCLLLNLPGPRRSLTPCCLPLRFPLAVWPPRSHLPKHGGRHKRQRRAAAGGLPPPVAVSWPPAGGWAAATANDITGRAATGGGVPGSHHAGRRASVVCGNRTAVAAGTWSRGGGREGAGSEGGGEVDLWRCSDDAAGDLQLPGRGCCFRPGRWAGAFFSLRRACTAAALHKAGGSVRIHADPMLATNLHCAV